MIRGSSTPVNCYNCSEEGRWGPSFGVSAGGGDVGPFPDGVDVGPFSGGVNLLAGDVEPFPARVDVEPFSGGVRKLYRNVRDFLKLVLRRTVLFCSLVGAA